MIKHLKRWNKWRKRCRNSKFHKFMVLIGVIKSPTFAFVFTDEEEQAYWKKIRKALGNGELD